MPSLTHWPLEYVVLISKVYFSNSLYRKVDWGWERGGGGGGDVEGEFGWGWGTHSEIAIMSIPQNITNKKINIGAGNGLVQSDIKPLPDLELIQIYVTLWCH